jgi:hypothetical protein
MLADWPAEDRDEFARLLTRANESITAMVERDQAMKPDTEEPEVTAPRG